MKANEIIEKYIKLTNCTSKELAKNSNLSESILSRYKNGNRIPSYENIKKISKAFSIISENKYKEEDILKEFNNINNTNTIDFQTVTNNFNILITALNINVSELAKYLNFDSSYLSRIKKGERTPSNKEEFISKLANYIYKKYTNNNYKSTISQIIKSEMITQEKIENWIITNKKEEENEINKFLKKLDDFDLNNYIKIIKFDELKVPNIPFYKGKKRNYYGLEEMKQGELEFFKTTVLSKSKEDIFMYSNMPMEDMAKDIEFGKKWMFAIAMSLKKGLHLNIIHNINRPFNEMMLGLESWIPIYMTGQISPFYLPTSTNIINSLNYVSGASALSGECIEGYHNKGKYYITNNNKEIKYYREKSNLLLKKAKPLMNIYKENNQESFKQFLEKETNIKTDIERYQSSLPIFTIEDNLLTNILKRNNLSKDEIKNIINYKKEEEKRTTKILKNNKIIENIYIPNNNEEIYLSLDNIFFNKKIKYTYEEYIKHLENTKKYKNTNYQLIINKNKTFKNINISIYKNNFVIISKNANPIIHFVIKHPKLINAIENFNPIIKE